MGTDEILIAWSGTILDGNWTVDYNGNTVTVPFTQYSVLLTSLTPDTEYTITVQGEDTGSNVTPVSDPVTATTEAEIGYTAPVITVVDVEGSDELLVAWMGVIPSGSWTVTYNGLTETVPFDQFSVRLTGLTPSTLYTITVQGEDDASDTTPVSAPETVTTEAAAFSYP
jgi:hypothetical protein